MSENGTKETYDDDLSEKIRMGSQMDLPFRSLQSFGDPDVM